MTRGWTRPCSRRTCATGHPLRFDDEIDVHLLLATATRATFQMAYLITVGDTVASTAVTVHGMVTAEGRPTRLPEWLIALAPPPPPTEREQLGQAPMCPTET